MMLWPRPPASLDVIGWDKANHALAFAALALTALLGRQGRSTAGAAAWLLALVAWGGVLELLQSQLPPRQGDWADLLANAVGVALGALLARGLGARLRRAAD